MYSQIFMKMKSPKSLWRLFHAWNTYFRLYFIRKTFQKDKLVVCDHKACNLCETTNAVKLWSSEIFTFSFAMMNIWKVVIPWTFLLFIWNNYKHSSFVFRLCFYRYSIHIYFLFLFIFHILINLIYWYYQFFIAKGKMHWFFFLLHALYCETIVLLKHICKYKSSITNSICQFPFDYVYANIYLAWMRKYGHTIALNTIICGFQYFFILIHRLT